MSGKAPLLLATLFFSVGAVGLALTSAERASWGPFEPRNPQPDQRVVIVDLSPSNIEPPELAQIVIPVPVELSAAEPEALVAEEPTSAPQPTPTPIPPLRVFGISSDSGVSAAAATSTPPPLRMVNVANGDESTETPEAVEASETPEAETIDSPSIRKLRPLRTPPTPRHLRTSLPSRSHRHGWVALVDDVFHARLHRLEDVFLCREDVELVVADCFEDLASDVFGFVASLQGCREHR